MKDYYKILGVQENATDDEIKKVYRKLSKEFHPDVNPDGAERFKEIAEAYENIGTQEKRNALKNRNNNPFAGTGFEDIFSNMFANMNPNMRRQHVPDKVVQVEIDPIQSYLGEAIKINYFRNVICSSCNGAGGNRKICESCRGQGFHSMVSGTGFFRQEVRKVCNDCGGEGYQLLSKCHDCDGRGCKPTAETLNVNLPVGADDGQFLRIQGYGDYNNGMVGNLVLQVRMVPKDGFEKIGNDLVLNKFVTLDDLKKDSLIVKHPNSDIRIDLPEEFDTSKPLKLRGKGYNGGDMYVRLNMKFNRKTLQ